MNSRERQGLLTRVRQIRRLAAQSERPAAASGPTDRHVQQSLEARITHLEQLLQGLQDSVHRESLRQSKRLSELEAQVQPEAMSRALSADARDRGL